YGCERHEARASRRLVHVDSAGTALSDATAKLRAGHTEVVPQDPKQRGFPVGLNGARFAVDLQLGLHGLDPYADADSGASERRGSGRCRALSWKNSSGADSSFIQLEFTAQQVVRYGSHRKPAVGQPGTRRGAEEFLEFPIEVGLVVVRI